MIKIKIILFLLSVFIFSCSQNLKNDENQQEEKVYTCSMHPQIIRKEPGNCPICGMKLVVKTNNTDSSGNDIRFLLKPANQYVIGKIKIVHADSMAFKNNIRATGTITYDTREINVISARVSGRITKLHVKYEYQEVKKGQKLMEIYSEELLTYQENLLLLLENDPENITLIQATEQKLLLLGITRQQIDKLKKDKSTIFSVSIFSPYTGHAHSFSSSTGNENKNNERMNMETKINKNAELAIREGSYVTKGQNLLAVYNTQNVWAVINVPNENMADIKTGDPITLNIDGTEEKKLHAEINFIEPEINRNQRTTSIRIYLRNSDQQLKIGMIVTAVIDAGLKKGIYIPVTSVVHLGKKDIVFIKDNKLFKSKTIVTGNKSENYIEVLSGINPHDEIAENAQMLIDSESFIKTSYEE